MDVLAQYHVLEICYLIASVSFIMGLKMLSTPRTARKGNFFAGIGMAIAISATIFLPNSQGTYVNNLGWIFGGMAVGTIIGYIMAKRVKMTAMPQMVSFFNGMGGACAAVISLIEFNKLVSTGHVESMMNGEVLVMLLGILIGSISFAGSMIAYGKLESKIKDKIFPFQQFINMGMFLVLIIIGGWIMFLDEPNGTLIYLLLALSLIYGVMFVLPIGGADMPVVISLLNSFTGMAAALGGFLYSNNVMLTGGILVGSAGTILTVLMCKAMNRSLTNVLLGAFGGNTSAAKSASGDQSVSEISISDAAVILSYAKRVIVVPGYGLAVAQAQHVCHELERLLEEKGVEFKYAVHPVAGRMPGHMNVLLAEADVPYDKLMEMDEANPIFPQTDVVLVIGANDVVNPAAHNDPASPIFGMPILDVENAKNTIVLKRSMNPGYAGIENQLFFLPKTRMLFGDAKDTLVNLVSEVKSI